MPLSIKDLLPPIFYRVIQFFYSRVTLVTSKPTWHKVLTGPLKGGEIYVNPKQPAFKEMISGTYDDFFWRFLKEIDLESRTILDIGSHIGYHAMCFSRLAGPEGKVYVFEPNNYNLERMEMIFDRNPEISKKIQINKMALSDFIGTTTFNYSSNVDNQTSSGSFIENSHKPLSDEVYREANFTTTSVKVETIDHFFKQQKINDLRLIKIDVEGAEGNVLRGGKETLKLFKPALLIEIHSVQAMMNVCQELYSLEYKVKILDKDGPSRCFVGALPEK